MRSFYILDLRIACKLSSQIVRLGIEEFIFVCIAKISGILRKASSLDKGVT
jgi:hypothetical protein